VPARLERAPAENDGAPGRDLVRLCGGDRGFVRALQAVLGRDTDVVTPVAPFHMLEGLCLPAATLDESV